MINIHVDAVLAVRDGFTGRPIERGLVCTLDGEPFRPVSKAGGYLVFTGLAEGEHSLVLRGGYYRDEHITLRASRQSRTEIAVSMKPGSAYPFGGAYTRARITLTGKGAAGAQVWLAAAEPLFEVKVAQDAVSKGDSEARVFIKCSAAQLAMPCNLLVEDGKSTEVVLLNELNDEIAYFTRPFAFSHKRSRVLRPAQLFTAGEDGVVEAAYRQPVKLSYFTASGRAGTLELRSGDNSAEIAL